MVYYSNSGMQSINANARFRRNRGQIFKKKNDGYLTPINSERMQIGKQENRRLRQKFLVRLKESNRIRRGLGIVTILGIIGILYLSFQLFY